MSDRDRIWEKLRRVEALRQGATTPGERAAAESARARLLERLEAAPEPPLEIGSAEVVASVDYDVPAGAGLPGIYTFGRVLRAWADGDLTREGVRAWASGVVGSTLLPICDLDDPRSLRVELLMQLSALDRQPLDPSDVPALLGFLQGEAGPAAWAAWFEWLRGRLGAARSLQ